MKKLMLLFMAILPTACLLAQDKPQEVTPEIAKKINAEIEKGIIALKQEDKNKKISPEELAYTIETYRIDQFMKRSVDYNYSTSGMNSAAYDAAEKYDSLLNKYYKLLLGKLGAEDKSALIEAQRAWITYRDKEMKLRDVLIKEKYSGGGTMQTTIYAGDYLTFISNRVSDLFNYYLKIITEGISN